jgi:hypothetical protein
MAASTRLRTLPLVGIAAAGVVLGHWAAYRLSLPRAHLREHILSQTGHAYWYMAVKAAVILGVTGAGGLFVRDLRGESRRTDSLVDLYTSVVVRLALLQGLAFTAIELMERAVTGAPVVEMFSHDLFLVGVSVQLLMACLGGIVVLMLSHTASLVTAALAAPLAVRGGARRYLPGPDPALAPQCLSGPCGPRGPPRS